MVICLRFAKKQLQDFGDDDEEALQVAVLHSANYANGNDDDDYGGGGKQRASTTCMHLSQTSNGSDPEVVKVRGRNIVDYTANRNELTTLQRKVAVTLTKNLSRPYDPATMNHLSSIREEEYDTPKKVEVLRNAIEDEMI